MRILIVNPNSSASMTRKIYASTVQLVAAGTEIEATNPLTSPASIEGHYDGAMALPGLVREIQKGETKGFDGYVVACFDDPGIGACREVATGPVIGICEAAMQAADPIGDIRGSADFRRELIGVLTRRALGKALARAREVNR